MKQLLWTPVNALSVSDLDIETQNRIARNITGQYADWKNMRRGQEDVWQEIDRQVSQYDPLYTPELKTEINRTIQNPGHLGSKLKLSNVYAHREGLTASLVNNLMANDYDFFDIDPLDSLDREAAESVKQYMLWLFGVMDFESSFTPFIRSLVQYGTAVASYEWVQETMPRWRREYLTDPITGAQMEVVFEAQDIVYNAPKFTPLSIYDVVVDPKAENLRTATLIYTKAVPVHEILANKKYAGLTYEIVSAAPDYSGNEYIERKIEKEHGEGNTNFAPDVAYKNKKMVYEAWGDFSDGQTLYKNYVAEVLNGQLIRFEPNPYLMPHKPFVVARYTVETDRVYGHTPLASITAMQAAYDTTVNQYIDYWSMEINRPIVVQANTIVRSSKDTDKTKLPPISKDAAWTVRDVNGIKRLDWGGRGGAPNPVDILTLLDSQMQKATGDNELTSGGAIDNQYLTTGNAMIRSEAGSAKTRMYARTMEKEAIVPVLEMTLDLLRQMGAQEERTFQTKNLPGASEVLFKPVYLLNDIKFTLRGASFNATKQVQVNALQQFLAMLSQNPMTMQMINWAKAIKVMGEALNVRNAMDLMIPEAAMGAQMPGPQLGFFDKIRNMWGAKAQTSGTQQQQFTNGLAPAVGGSTPEGTSPFNLAQP